MTLKIFSFFSHFFIFVYIHRERGREREIERQTAQKMCTHFSKGRIWIDISILNLFKQFGIDTSYL